MFHIKNILNRMMGLSLLASLGFAALLCAASPALAANAPALGLAATFGILSSTYTNTVAGTTINGDLGYTTAPAVVPTVNGTTHVADPTYNQAGLDQGTALGILNGQPCVSLGAGAVNLDNNPGHTTGIYTPGCYFSGGAMNITVNKTVTLNGAGVYIFRPGGALTTEANTSFVLAGGACESDVYWAPVGATTIGATTAFVGNILDAAGITIGHFSTLTGRALAFGGTVTTDANTITVPTCVPVPPLGGVTLAKAFSPATIIPGQVSTLTITLSNNNSGIGFATLNAALVDNLPVGLTTVGLPSTTCGGTPPTVTATSVTLPIGATIPAGSPGTCTVTVVVTAPSAGVFVNTFAPGDLSVDINGSHPVSNTTPVSVPLPAVINIPTLNEWGAIFFMVLAGLGSIFYLRKQKRI